MLEVVGASSVFMLSFPTQPGMRSWLKCNHPPPPLQWTVRHAKPRANHRDCVVCCVFLEGDVCARAMIPWKTLQTSLGTIQKIFFFNIYNWVTEPQPPTEWSHKALVISFNLILNQLFNQPITNPTTADQIVILELGILVLTKMSVTAWNPVLGNSPPFTYSFWDSLQIHVTLHRTRW